MFNDQSECDNNNSTVNQFGTFGFPYANYGFMAGSDYSPAGTCSDRRIKTSIKTLENSLENILRFDVVEYDWNNKISEIEYKRLEGYNKLHSIGLIAQNVKEFYPMIVKVGPDGYYYIEYRKLNAVLVEAIKEQQVFIDDIEKDIKALETLLK